METPLARPWTGDADSGTDRLHGIKDIFATQDNIRLTGGLMQSQLR